MKKLKLILIIFLGLNLYTHAYSKPFESKIIFERVNLAAFMLLKIHGFIPQKEVMLILLKK